jgi:hypothetical protein
MTKNIFFFLRAALQAACHPLRMKKTLFSRQIPTEGDPPAVLAPLHPYTLTPLCFLKELRYKYSQAIYILSVSTEIGRLPLVADV